MVINMEERLIEMADDVIGFALHSNAKAADAIEFLFPRYSMVTKNKLLTMVEACIIAKRNDAYDPFIHPDGWETFI